MRVCDSFIDKGRVYAACTGSGIKKGMTIGKIRVGGVEFQVRRMQVQESFIGVPQAMFEVDGSRLVPDGEVTVVS